MSAEAVHKSPSESNFSAQMLVSCGRSGFSRLSCSSYARARLTCHRRISRSLLAENSTKSSPGAVEPSGGRGTFCEFKGAASYLDAIGADGVRVPRAAWFYPDPSPGFEAIRGAVAFYPALMDECTLDGEPVVAQEGDFYGGWISGEVAGPFKGGPGTLGW